MSLDLNSHRTQLVLTAAAASAATFGLFSAYNSYNRQKKREALNADVLRSVLSHPGKGARSEHPSPIKLHSKLPAPEDIPSRNAEDLEYDEELIREQLARNYAFFGDEAMDKIRKGRVVVVGCGGVGSWAAVMLVRSGITNIRLVDFDYVTLSSLNRHATATLADVGTPKVKCIERTLKEISRWVQVDARIDIWRKENGGDLLEDADWVIDAIDNITTKVDLLKYCHDHKIKVFSSMGAGAKNDPTRVQISDISYTVYDPLARSVRRRLRLQGVNSGIPVVYSTEVPGDVKLLPLPEEEFKKGDVKELGVFDDFRVRILPVLGPLPSIFGLHIATYILCEIAGKPISNPLAIKGRKKVYEKLYRDLFQREQKIAGAILNRLPLDEDDVGLLLDDIHRGRSIIPPYAVPNKPTLIRWDPRLPLTLENTVVMDYPDAEKHAKACFKAPVTVGENALHGNILVGDEAAGEKRPEEVWDQEVVDVVKRRAEEIKKVRECIL
ncbi:ubiquitin-protein ligase molybdopterin-converting factor [Abortiporus biennis]|nr:ubiquitin-protein ligase molybdopterin-converting factor [Abortiporus biennis]